MIDEKEGERKSLFGNKFFFIVPVIIIAVVLFVVMLYSSGHSEINKFFSCGDGTSSGSCSANKPYFCDRGELIEKAGFCSCPNSMIPEGDLCSSVYATEPKEITLNYTLDGKKDEIDFVVYKGMVDYVSDLPKTIHYSNGAQPSRQDFKLRNINESEQREFLLPLVVEIENRAGDKMDQARIAISLVQEIPFGNSEKTVLVGKESGIEYSRYPYEVLYDMKGVCGEKSELLSFLLKELGFDTSIFYYLLENHEAVGVKCPSEYGVGKTGYCFVETSAPSIITNNELKYTGGAELLSTPEVILISKGNSLENDLREYEDAEEFLEIEKKIEEKGKISFFENLKLEKLRKRYGLAEVYNI